MAKKYDRDVLFMFKAVLFAAGVMLVLQLMRPYIVPPDPLIPKIAEFREEIKILKPADLKPLLEKKRPLMVVAYASWCGYCRIYMPSVVEYVRSGEMKGVEPLFLSLDYKRDAMSQYLVRTGFYTAFTPYLLDGESRDTLVTLLQAAGGRFSRHIPYAALLDADGKVVADWVGIVDKERLQAAIAGLRQ